jgi:hypothetical protein
MHRHGTTLARPGIERYGVAHNWGTHILEAFEKANKARDDKSGQIVYVEAVDDM